MVTILKNWHMVYLFGLPDGSNMQQRWGRLVTGEVVMDGEQAIKPGTRICSEPVLRSPGNLVHTRTGKVYSLFGEGQTVELPATLLDKLRGCNSPAELAVSVGNDWKAN